MFVFAALIPWTLFSQGFAAAAVSLASQQNLLTKVYFPRLFVPVAAASVFLVDLAYSLGIYAFVLLYYHVTPSWTIIFLPLLIVVTLIATLSLGVMLSALTVFYRDFRHLVPFLTQIFMYFTPVIYPAEPDSREVSLVSGPQSDVRARFRVPLGYFRRALAFSESGYFHDIRPGVVSVCRLLFPPDRTSLRRLRLISVRSVPPPHHGFPRETRGRQGLASAAYQGARPISRAASNPGLDHPR